MAPKQEHGYSAPSELADKTKFEPKGVLDPIWAIFFVINVAAFVAYAGYVTFSGHLSLAIHMLRSELAAALLQGNFSNASVNPEAASVVLIALSLMFSVMYACLWMMVLQMYPEKVVTSSMYVVAVVCIIDGLMCLVSGGLISVIAGIFMVMLGLISFCLPMCLREQLKFTARIVKGVSNVYSGHKTIFLVAILCIILQVCWIALSIMSMMPAAVSAYTAEQKRRQEAHVAWQGQHPVSGGGAIMPLVLCAFSCYWGLQVFSNLLHISCSGVISRYYFNKQVDSAVYKSTSQAFTSYVGPVALGSLLVAIIQTLRFMAEQARRDQLKGAGRDRGSPAEQCVVCILCCCVACCLSCLESLLETFNTFCFIITAMYGTSFCASASEVKRLLSSRGEFQVIYQWNYVGIVCFAGILVGALIVATLVAGLALILLPSEYIWMCGSGAFLITIAVMIVVSRVFDSGCDTLIVCYVEEPHKSKSSADEIYDALQSMNEFRPISA